MDSDISVWSGTWQSGYPGVTGTMKIPLYSSNGVENNVEYTTYCETMYTGWYARGKTIRLDIDVVPGDPYPTLSAKNGNQTITYTITMANENDMRGVYKSVSPGDTGSWSMSR